MGSKRTYWLIHGFALLHLATAIGCRMLGVPDTLFLTLLTMTMTIFICLWEKISLDVTALCIIFVNIIGFAAGIGLAALLELVEDNDILIHSISTLLTTEMLGFALLYFTRTRMAKWHNASRHPDKQLFLLIVAVAGIYLIRIAIELLSNQGPVNDSNSNEILVTAFALLIFIMDLAFIASNVRKNIEEERSIAERARFQYMNLKQQVNPHFLFNSLNALDALVCEGHNETASRYIHQLSGIYRYMLKNEKEDVVPLEDEMTFAGMYADLMKMRFPKGLEFHLSVKQEDMSRYVIPCSIQLLVENALKHNAVSVEDPLIVEVSSDGEFLQMSNNVKPRISKFESTGLGLSYIKQQYQTLAGKEVEIESDENRYTVKLPLI